MTRFIIMFMIIMEGILSGKIDDYNSSFYYDAPQNILNAYLYQEIE